MSAEQPVALVVPKIPARERTTHRALALARRLATPLLLVLAWWVSTTRNWVDPSILPSPHTVLRAIVTLWTHDQFAYQLEISLGRALLGTLIGTGLGLLLGLVAGLWRLGEEICDSTLQMLRTIPPLALVPLFIVWFGIGETPKLLLISMTTFFPMYINVYAGVRNVDVKVVEAMRSFGLTGPRLVWEVLIPLTLPSIFTGLRYALGISVLILIAAEQINASAGLGYLLSTAQQYQQVDVILICIAVYAVLGLGADLGVRVLERLCMPWRTTTVVQ